MDNQYTFSGWATRYNVKCSDGRTIMNDAFKHCDGQKVPLVWNHSHNDPSNVVGHAVLEHRAEGIYMYGSFNDTQRGQDAKEDVMHGDITGLSIYANRLRQRGPAHDRFVEHGDIKEVSLVFATANPEAFIDTVLSHGDNPDDEEVIIYSGEEITLCHSEDEVETEEESEEMSHADDEDKGETVRDVLNTLTEKQRNAVSYVIGEIKKSLSEEDEDEDESDEKDEKESDEKSEDKSKSEEKSDDKDDKTETGKENNNIKHSEGGNDTMKHNVFDKNDVQNDAVLTHADQTEILKMAKNSSIGSLRNAISAYAEESETLKHAFVNDEGEPAIETLFPEYKDLHTGAPETLERDQSWVSVVMNKIKKSPISRIRTRQADARDVSMHAKGYQKKGDKKEISGQIKLLSRTTDPQTVYRKDELHRDDIIDITDFDVVEYQYGLMRRNLEEEIALAALIGDGRDDGDPDKIHEDHIRSIWNDADLYTIHYDLDVEATKNTLQGSNTGANFGENYIYAEAIITAALYSREQYKGTGTPDLYCDPHLVNVMLLARDMNGRRIYDSKADLAAALNVANIYTVEQFKGKTRTDKNGKEKKLLGLFVNLADYQFGATKGGEITRFNQFDIDFNKEKYLIETRLSGALTRVYSAIALEEPVSAEG